MTHGRIVFDHLNLATKRVERSYLIFFLFQYELFLSVQLPVLQLEMQQFIDYDGTIIV